MDSDNFATALLDDETEQEFELQLALALVLVLGADEARIARTRRRNPSRLYLRRSQLMPEPRLDLPWQRLYESQDDRAFITTMGVNVETFHVILDNGFEDSWNKTPIPRANVSPAGQPRNGARSLDAAGALGLTLHYLGSAMLEISLQQVFAIIPSTVSRYLDFSKSLLLQTLKCMPEGSISFPNDMQYEEFSAMITARHPLLVGAFGSVDGLNLIAQTADDPEIENATYNAWKEDHFISNVFAFSPKGISFLTC